MKNSEIENSYYSLEEKGRTFTHHGTKFLILIGILLPFSLWSSAIVLQPKDMSAYLLDVSHWLPNNSPLIADMEKFSNVMGEDRGKVIRISWEGCSESDERIRKYTENLRSMLIGESTPIREILTTRDIVNRLRKSATRLTDEQIYAQLENVMIGTDGTTCVLVTCADRIPAIRNAAIEMTLKAADLTPGLKADDLRLFGGPVYTKN